MSQLAPQYRVPTEGPFIGPLLPPPVGEVKVRVVDGMVETTRRTGPYGWVVERVPVVHVKKVAS